MLKHWPICLIIATGIGNHLPRFLERSSLRHLIAVFQCLSHFFPNNHCFHSQIKRFKKFPLYFYSGFGIFNAYISSEMQKLYDFSFYKIRLASSTCELDFFFFTPNVQLLCKIARCIQLKWSEIMYKTLKVLFENCLVFSFKNELQSFQTKIFSDFNNILPQSLLFAIRLIIYIYI